ncbi:hypothetical protein CYMTET_24770 [Cymbomonas tetramitiformis]|uniref:Uncharacterized protein n=1 Tax=Cymbomonas tetramitiformis TaxID=36881 RepID=A0AAE0FVW6_9CHLO|nr:hypothetical protein CYMTET_24770 [Cymbomonas tetramitiformis]
MANSDTSEEVDRIPDTTQNDACQEELWSSLVGTGATVRNNPTYEKDDKIYSSPIREVAESFIAARTSMDRLHSEENATSAEQFNSMEQDNCTTPPSNQKRNTAPSIDLSEISMTSEALREHSPALQADSLTSPTQVLKKLARSQSAKCQAFLKNGDQDIAVHVQVTVTGLKIEDLNDGVLLGHFPLSRLIRWSLPQPDVFSVVVEMAEGVRNVKLFGKPDECRRTLAVFVKPVHLCPLSCSSYLTPTKPMLRTITLLPTCPKALSQELVHPRHGREDDETLYAAVQPVVSGHRYRDAPPRFEGPSVCQLHL